jgi:hypothetical protein
MFLETCARIQGIINNVILSVQYCIDPGRILSPYGNNLAINFKLLHLLACIDHFIF